MNAAPGTLDTLNELAAALGDDPNFATTITNLIAGKAPLVHDHDDRYYTEAEADARYAADHPPDHRRHRPHRRRRLSANRTLAVDVGTGAGKIVQLDGDAKLPAVDGSRLANLPACGFTRCRSGRHGSGAAADKAVTPAIQHHHPGHPKFWAYVSGNGSTLYGSHNVASKTDNGGGDLTITFATPFADTNYGVLVTPRDGGSLGNLGMTIARAVGSVRLYSHDGSSGIDPSEWDVAGYGDQ